MSAAMDGEEPGWAMRAMAAELAECGLKADTSEREDSRLLTVTGAGRAQVEICADDDRGMLCEYFSAPSSDPDVGEVAGVALRMLGVSDNAPARTYAHLHYGVTLPGATGREMTARGLKARLDVVEDHELYEVTADVLICNPARPERGQVRLAGGGPMLWECHVGDLPGGAAEVAGTIADILMPRLGS